MIPPGQWGVLPRGLTTRGDGPRILRGSAFHGPITFQFAGFGSVNHQVSWRMDVSAIGQGVENTDPCWTVRVPTPVYDQAEIGVNDR